jgi:DNA-binding helix-hairpin-helix protein with protein kinase domain
MTPSPAFQHAVADFQTHLQTCFACALSAKDPIGRPGLCPRGQRLSAAVQAVTPEPDWPVSPPKVP